MYIPPHAYWRPSRGAAAVRGCIVVILMLAIASAGAERAGLSMITPRTPHIAIVRGVNLGDGGELMAGVAQRHFEAVKSALDQVRIPSEITSDSEIEARGVPDVDVLILPYNRAISSTELERILAFIDSGGYVIACYLAPDTLMERLGVEALGPTRAPEVIGDAQTIHLQQDWSLGMPDSIVQPTSWLMRCRATDSGSVIGWWKCDESGRVPAVVAGPSGAFIACGLTDDHRPHVAALLRALSGKWAEQIWGQSIPTRPEDMGPYGPYRNLDSLAEHVQQKASEGQNVLPALRNLAEAFALLSSAAALRDKEHFAESLAAAQKADRRASVALWESFQPVEGEMRGVWMHNHAKPSWEEAARRLSEANINAVFPYMASAGTAFYKSRFLPQHKSITEQGDFLNRASQACRKYDIPLHPRLLNLATLWATEQTKKKLQKAGRLVVTDKGETGTWLCPTHPANRRLQVDLVSEIVSNYDVAGIQFDYLRYPWKNVCFCDRCRAEFEQMIGHEVKNWPKDAAEGGPLYDEYLQFRRRQINTLVGELYGTVKAIDPETEVSAAVFINWESHRDTFGQDWKRWVDYGWVDFVCPMDYTDDPEKLRSYVRRQKGWVGERIPMFVGLGVNADNCRFRDPWDTLRQIEIAREEGADGWVIFNYCPAFVNEILPVLSLGVSRTRTEYALQDGERP